MNVDKNKLIKSIITIAGITIFVTVLANGAKKNSKTLTQYANENPDLNYKSVTANAITSLSNSDLLQSNSGSLNKTTSENSVSQNIISKSLSTDDIVDYETEDTLKIDFSNQNALETNTIHNKDWTGNKMTYADGFYYEAISSDTYKFIQGKSFPVSQKELSEMKQTNKEYTNIYDSYSKYISIDDLTYVHILHIDFDGNVKEGELICNKAIAKDLVEIFYELYQNNYRIEKVRLVDEYDADDEASMADNNTSCFNFRKIANSDKISNHSYGLAIDINPLYNPYITYNKDGSKNIAPQNAANYADRTLTFPYKIDTDDLCYKLFTEHGFSWGGNWNSSKDYQHFEKNIDEVQ